MTYQKINNNIPYSYLCTGNGMSENQGCITDGDILQMEKVLACWPDPGLQSISTKTQVCWVAKSGIRLYSSCATFKPSEFGGFLTPLYFYCHQVTGFWLINYLWNSFYLCLLETCKRVPVELDLLVGGGQLQLEQDETLNSSYTNAKKMSIFYLTIRDTSLWLVLLIFFQMGDWIFSCDFLGRGKESPWQYEPAALTRQGNVAFGKKL